MPSCSLGPIAELLSGVFVVCAMFLWRMSFQTISCVWNGGDVVHVNLLRVCCVLSLLA